MYKKLFLYLIAAISLSNHFMHSSEEKPWGCGPWVAVSSFTGAGFATTFSPIPLPATVKIAITLGSGIIGGALGFSVEQIGTVIPRKPNFRPQWDFKGTQDDDYLAGIKTGIKLVLPPLAFMIATTSVLLHLSQKQ